MVALMVMILKVLDSDPCYFILYILFAFTTVGQRAQGG